ncbi:MAG: hypothetical protein K2M98_00725 [Muribaculum sp.]|nr:hypothetical protein [Muribaculum sp.]
MKRVLIILAAIITSVTAFSRTVGDVKQILCGEWYQEGSNHPGWIKYNSDGTGALMEAVIFFFDDSIADFTWSLLDDKTLVTAYPNNKVFRETIAIIDNNTIRLNGTKYIRRGSKSATSSSSSSSASKPKSNTTQHTSTAPAAKIIKPIVIKHVKSPEDFPIMYSNLIGMPFDFRDSDLAQIKAYCDNNGYSYTGKEYDRLKLIQVSNPVTEIFGQNFEVNIHESNGFVYENGQHVKMSLEWYSPRYSSLENLESDFSRFTSEIEKAGGIFDGYDETCHRSMYHFPNGVKISTKAWDTSSMRIQLFVNLP